jgi:SulP family sulfate permease
VNLRLGGRTQVVGHGQAGGVALVLLFLTGALALLPKATLGAVIIYAALGLMDVARGGPSPAGPGASCSSP